MSGDMILYSVPSHCVRIADCRVARPLDCLLPVLTSFVRSMNGYPVGYQTGSPSGHPYGLHVRSIRTDSPSLLSFDSSLASFFGVLGMTRCGGRIPQRCSFFPLIRVGLLGCARLPDAAKNEKARKTSGMNLCRARSRSPCCIASPVPNRFQSSLSAFISNTFQLFHHLLPYVE